jgi:malate dehydrogenase
MKIAIIGAAGNIGSAAAFNIAMHQITDELVMIDAFSQDKLEQYVYDLKTAVTGLDILVRAGSDEDMTGSNIVIMAAGSAQITGSRLEVLPQNLPIIKGVAEKVKKLCPEAVVITATNPVCPLNYAMYRYSGLPRRQFIGYSENDSIRFRMFLAEDMGIKSSQVEATVIGEHGNSQVLLFSSVKVKGHPFPVNPEIQRRIQRRVADLHTILEPQRVKTGRTAAWTTSVGITSICRAISHNTREMIPCSVVLDGEYGGHDMSTSVPVVLGKGGVVEIQKWMISANEQELLKHSISSLKPAMQYVDDSLK